MRRRWFVAEDSLASVELVCEDDGDFLLVAMKVADCTDSVDLNESVASDDADGGERIAAQVRKFRREVNAWAAYTLERLGDITG